MTFEASPIQIHWHDKQPIFAADFDKNCSIKRFATCGGDFNVRVTTFTSYIKLEIWEIYQDEIRFLSTLKRHTKSVNCVRFANKGGLIASSGDDGMIIEWKYMGTGIKRNTGIFADEDEEDNIETWSPVFIMRASDMEDIYDLCWSADDQFIVAGLTDNSIQIWNTITGKLLKVIKDHSHFVQGVAWVDPLNEFIATQSSDRSCRVYSVSTNKNGLALTTINNVSHMYVNNDQKKFRIFHEESLISFFRRLQFSPDGSLLFVPSGLFKKKEDDAINCVYIFSRGKITGKPVACLPGFEKAPIAVRPCPILFKLREVEKTSFIDLPYRIVFAVVTLDILFIYDTQHDHPIAIFKNLHYSALTDAAWSPDASRIVLTSNDGFCSLVKLNSSIGEPLEQLNCPVLSVKTICLPEKKIKDKIAKADENVNPFEDGIKQRQILLHTPTNDDEMQIEADTQKVAIAETNLEEAAIPIPTNVKAKRRIEPIFVCSIQGEEK